MTQVKCINCGEFHQVDSIDGEPGNKHAKVKYICPENEILYGSNRLVDELRDVSRQSGELLV